MREADKFKKLEEKELPKAEEAWKLLEDFHRIVVFKESMSNSEDLLYESVLQKGGTVVYINKRRRTLPLTGLQYGSIRTT